MVNACSRIHVGNEGSGVSYARKKGTAYNIGISLEAEQSMGGVRYYRPGVRPVHKEMRPIHLGPADPHNRLV